MVIRKLYNFNLNYIYIYIYIYITLFLLKPLGLTKTTNHFLIMSKFILFVFSISSSKILVFHKDIHSLYRASYKALLSIFFRRTSLSEASFEAHIPRLPPVVMCSCIYGRIYKQSD